MSLDLRRRQCRFSILPPLSLPRLNFQKNVVGCDVCGVETVAQGIRIFLQHLSEFFDRLLWAILDILGNGGNGLRLVGAFRGGISRRSAISRRRISERLFNWKINDEHLFKTEPDMGVGMALRDREIHQFTGHTQPRFPGKSLTNWRF